MGEWARPRAGFCPRGPPRGAVTSPGCALEPCARQISNIRRRFRSWGGRGCRCGWWIGQTLGVEGVCWDHFRLQVGSRASFFPGPSLKTPALLNPLVSWVDPVVVLVLDCRTRRGEARAASGCSTWTARVLIGGSLGMELALGRAIVYLSRTLCM